MPHPLVLARRAVAGAAVVTAVGLGQAALGDSGTPATPAPASVEEGRTLYQSSCASCHGQSGEGTQRGPTLVGVGAASVDWWVSTGRMPLEQEKLSPERGTPKFGRGQIDELIDYVTSFGGGGGPAVPAVSDGDATRGRQLFLTNCAACHSATGVGAAQVGGQAAPSVFDATPTQLGEAVRIGPGLMPKFSSGVIDDRGLSDINAYVRDLHDSSRHGGSSLGLVGPVVETVVGFVGLFLIVLVIRRLGVKR